MSRISHVFDGRPAFMPYYPLGYPTLPDSIDVIEALARNGADLIEVGLSFSDPLADGPVVQQATQTALQQGITLKKSLAAVRELRSRGVETPFVLMGYYNPLLAYGLDRLARDVIDAGADGFIVPDLPPEESAEFEAAVAPLPQIRMLAPTTPDERLGRVLDGAAGFVYMVSVTGVTGARARVADDLGDFIGRVRAVTRLPLCVGFGIGTPEQAREVSRIADGVIVGSATVKAVGASDHPAATAAEFASAFRRALDEGRGV